jgi:hypothetical protein
LWRKHRLFAVTVGSIAVAIRLAGTETSQAASLRAQRRTPCRWRRRFNLRLGPTIRRLGLRCGRTTIELWTALVRFRVAAKPAPQSARSRARTERPAGFCTLLAKLDTARVELSPQPACLLSPGKAQALRSGTICIEARPSPLSHGQNAQGSKLARTGQRVPSLFEVTPAAGNAVRVRFGSITSDQSRQRLHPMSALAPIASQFGKAGKDTAKSGGIGVC